MISEQPPPCADAAVRQEMEAKYPTRPAFVVEANVRSEVARRKLTEMNRLSHADFRGYGSVGELRQALKLRHGRDILADDWDSDVG